MRIALVGAEFEENLAIRYIWGALKRAGHEVVPIVFNGRDQVEAAAQRLTESGADLAGFSMIFTYRAREFADLAVESRRRGYRGHLTAGGHFAAFHADELLREVPAIDSVAVGEGEGILVELAANWPSLTGVKGLIWRTPDGEVVHHPPASNPDDLDSLAWPVRKSPPDRFLGMPIVNLLSSRGCTHACAFCSIAAWHRRCGGSRHRERSVARVAEEMVSLYGQGIRIFNFHDDNFFPPTRAAALAKVRALKRELEARAVGQIAFAIKARPDEVDAELFALLKGFGLFRVFLGIEAGTADSLRRLGRGQTCDENERALEIVNRLDLHACFNLLLFNPDSTREDFQANVGFLRAHPHNPMNFCRTEIYSGTPLEKKLRREGRLLGDFWGYNYRMADPRAQAAFELIYAAFGDRCYGETCLQHLTMDVDYEYQIFAHFFSGNRALRKRVKDFIIEVNLDTCRHLEEVADIVGRSNFCGESQRQAGSLRVRIAKDTARLKRTGYDLLREIRVAAAIGHVPRQWDRVGRVAAAAGVAAVLTVGTASCEAAPSPSHKCEMVAALPPSHEKEMAPSPPLNQTTSAVDENLKGAIRDWLLHVVVRVVRPRAIEMDISLDASGKVTRFSVTGELLSASEKDALKEIFASQAFNDLHGKVDPQRGVRLRFRFTREEMEKAYQATTTPHEIVAEPPTQICEMAPAPVQDRPPKSHPTERVPEPPK